MDRNAKIHVAGHRGLAGSAVVRALERVGYTNLLLRSSKELDLTDQAATRDFYEREKPEYVIDCAAKVGGIGANSTLPAEFIHANLAIQTNVIHEAWRADVKRLLFLGSTCVYPRDCLQPIKEEYLLAGPLEPSNRPYALAKIAGVEMCWAYNRQYGTRFAAPMPTNLYGPNDNYHPEHSHVIAALIRKFWEAKKLGAESIEAWGTGSPLREFLHADDMAEACLHLLRLPDAQWDAVFPPELAPIVNLGTGEEHSIKELTEIVGRALSAEAKVRWDSSRPDGTPRKISDCARIHSSGWRSRVALEDGIRALIPELERVLKPDLR